MLYPIAPLGLNGLEIVLAVIAAFGLLCLGSRLGWTVRDRILLLTFTIPVLVLSVTETTQFMTMDEVGISAELLDPTRRGISALSAGAFVTGLPIALVVTRLLEFLQAGATEIRMSLKAVWWLLGTGVVAALAFTLLRLSERTPEIRPIRFAAAFAVIMLLPTTQLALKTFNYDLLSFGCGALAVLLLLRFIFWNDRPAGKCALLAAILAAHEKLTAGPVLLAVIIVLSIASASDVQPLHTRVWRTVTVASSAIAAVIVVSAVFLLIYRLFGPLVVPQSFWAQPLFPLSSWAWPVLRMIWPIETVLQANLSVSLGAISAMVIGVAAAGAALPQLARWQRIIAEIAIWWSRPVAVMLMLGLLVAGIIGVLSVQSYWAPFHPSPLPHGMQSVNGVMQHVGASTFVEHYLGMMLFALAVLVVAVPSAVWAVGLVGLCSLLRGGDRTPRTFLVPVVFMLAALLTPIGAVITGFPFAHRYFNLSLGLLSFACLSLFFCGIDSVQGPARCRIRVCSTILLIAALIIETSPFRPLFAAFRPFWLQYDDATQAELGRLNASWMGWGEEIMTAGKMLESACLSRDQIFDRAPCSDITLYALHSGYWLPGPKVINVSYIGKRANPPLDSKSFYVMNRLALIVNFLNIPQIEPDLTVAYGGYVLAWIYRGDRLANAGYRFD